MENKDKAFEALPVGIGVGLMISGMTMLFSKNEQMVKRALTLIISGSVVSLVGHRLAKSEAVKSIFL